MTNKPFTQHDAFQNSMSIGKGDKVFLKSGSPPLTVEDIKGDIITVSYLDENKTRMLTDFNRACIQEKDPLR